MIPAFILANPPKKIRRNKMAKRKSAARGSYQALASRLMKQYGGPRGMQMASAEWRKRKGGAASNRPKASKRRAKRNPGTALKNPYFRYQVPGTVTANPYFKYGMSPSASYNPYIKAHKRKSAKVKGHYRKAAKSNPGRSKARRNYFRYKAGSALANPEFFEAAMAGTSSPGRTASPMKGTSKAATGFLKAFATKDFVVERFIPLAVGFAGTKMVLGMLIKSQEPLPTDSAEMIEKKRERLNTLDKYRSGLYAGGGLALGLTAGLLFKNVNWAVGIATGGLFAGLQTFLERFEFYRAWFSLPPLNSETKEGLGALSTSAKDKIAKMVEAEVARSAASMSGLGRGMGAFVTESELRTPQSFAGMDAFATESDLRQPKSGPGASGVQGVSMDEFLAGPDMGL